MVKLALQLKATLENVTDFRVSSPDRFVWYLKFECSQCHTRTDKFHDVSMEESSSIAGSRGEANFLMKCKFCSHEGNLNIELTKPPASYTSEDSDKHAFKTMVIFECRGLEPVGWQPGSGWACQGVESSTKFDQIDLSESNEWMDYDEKSKEAVSITELEHRFVKVK